MIRAKFKDDLIPVSPLGDSGVYIHIVLAFVKPFFRAPLYIAPPAGSCIEKHYEQIAPKRISADQPPPRTIKETSENGHRTRDINKRHNYLFEP